MTVYVATDNPIKLRAVEAVVREFGLDQAVERVDSRGGNAEQPKGKAVERGAIARAACAAAHAARSEDLGIGIEAGLIRTPGGRWINVHVCAVADRTGRIAVGFGPGFTLPPLLEAAALEGEPLGKAAARMLDLQDTASCGAVYPLSGGRVEREALVRGAVRAALRSWRACTRSPNA